MQIPYIIDLLGTAVFAVSGALAASGKNLYRDIFSVSFMGFLTAIGGGTIRDITLGSYPIAWVKDQNYLIAIFCGVIFAIFLNKYIIRFNKVLFLFDSIGIAIYTIVGLNKALNLNVAPVSAVILGMFSAVMGGVIRDTLINELPLIFRNEIYATACLAGGFTFIFLKDIGVATDINAYLSIAIIIAIRVIVVKYKLSLPDINI